MAWRSRHLRRPLTTMFALCMVAAPLSQVGSACRLADSAVERSRTRSLPACCRQEELCSCRADCCEHGTTPATPQQPAGAMDQDQRLVWSAAHSKLVIDTQASGARSQAALAAFKPLFSELATLQVRHVRIQP